MNGDERLSRCSGSCPVCRLVDVVVVPSHLARRMSVELSSRFRQRAFTVRNIKHCV